MVERLVINLAFHAHRKWFCVLFPNLPLSAFRETYLGKKAKQMIWLQCWRRATSVSKSHGPLTGINLPVPEMLGCRASGPPLRNGLCFQLSFLLRGIHHGSSHPTGPQHLETPAPIVPGNSPLLPLPLSHWHTYSPFQFGEVKHYSSYILLFSKFIFFLLKDSDLSHELKHQWWNWKHSTHLSSNLKVEPYHQHWREKQALTCPTVVSPGDKTKAFLIHWSWQKSNPQAEFLLWPVTSSKSKRNRKCRWMRSTAGFVGEARGSVGKSTGGEI